MTRMLCRMIVVWAAWLPAAAMPADETTRPPNVLLVVADDLGWADVGWHGGTPRTPVMDRLVKEGVELDRHYVQPVCTPTRAALLSGRWTGRFGPQALVPSNIRVYPPGQVTLATALKQCGYTTHLAGKWHLGSDPEWGPWNHGFDHSFGSLAGAVDPWTHQYRRGRWQNTWHRDGKPLNQQGRNATELVAAEAETWIRSAKRPWFVYVPFHAVHIPVDTPDEYKKLYAGVNFGETDPQREESRRRFAAFVSQLDAKIGQLVKAIDETGQRRNTLIIFTSDNGGLHDGGNAYVSEVPSTPALSVNLPLKGQKNTLYEGGVRVPAFVNWPGRLKPATCEAPIHAADWMPTITNLADWKPQADPKFDGIDVFPAVSGSAATTDHRVIYIPHPSGAIVLRDGWKLIVRKARARSPDTEPAVELFNVKTDPSETKNVAAANPEKVRELQAVLEKLRKDDMTTLPADLTPEGTLGAGN
jgi:arylsulfatase A-like enzyme